MRHSRLSTRNPDRSGARGQSLAETALVVLLITALIVTVVDVGWAFMRASMIMHAARDGARFGATLPPAMRDTDTACFTGDGRTEIEQHVQAALNTVGFTTGSVSVEQNDCADGEVPTVSVTVDGTMETLFSLMSILTEKPGQWTVSRSVIFEDEARKCPSTCS